MKAHNLRRGLSLIELMLVVTIIGLLAGLVVPRITDNTTEAQIKTCLHNRAHLNSAAERYAVLNQTAPTSLGDLDVLDYFPGGMPVCPVTGNAYSLNATTNRVEGHTSLAAPGDH